MSNVDTLKRNAIPSLKKQSMGAKKPSFSENLAGPSINNEKMPNKYWLD